MYTLNGDVGLQVQRAPQVHKVRVGPYVGWMLWADRYDRRVER